MKEGLTKYIACLFFISVFVLNGLTDVLPGMIFHADDLQLMEQLVHTQNNEESNQSDNKGEAIKELYIDAHHSLLFSSDSYSVAQKAIAVIHLLYKQRVYFSIPTPPPKMA